MSQLKAAATWGRGVGSVVVRDLNVFSFIPECEGSHVLVYILQYLYTYVYRPSQNALALSPVGKRLIFFVEYELEPVNIADVGVT